MTTSLTPVAIAVRPWFGDHCFGGRIVLPAVETMLLLAAEVKRSCPEIDVRVMEDVRFAKFLEIPPGSTTVAALVECSRNDNGALCARLFSRVRFKAMTRLKEHGEILFPPAAESNRAEVAAISPAPLAGPVIEVEVDRIYRELVPFGPAYHTLQDTLFLSGQGAWGKLKAPVLPAVGSMQEIIGSPFPLDGALHAACVLGQRSADFVPFPVELGRRIVRRPTQAGGSYITRVVPVSRTSDELVFDLGIFDNDGQIYETVTGVRMRDVSRGTIKPPAWMKK
ncbi:hypothetical protein BMS3Bbin14_02186 [bacterium BMS3Bbin14]|nr:hypothetical protein BMS3Abin13_00229 [bacterium BMS3Abin13]GBE53684.1 hypothetical protein BMS3Bbin14_02186 [bacterium BMS3Bbin14]HDO29569.1 hypothetical protein [Desulfobacteraceae bacterium]